MNVDIQVFGDLLVWLFDQNPNPAAVGGPVGSLYSMLLQSYPAIGNRNELISLLPKKGVLDGSFRSANKYLYLKPAGTSNEWQPVLTVKFDFTNTLPEVRLRIGLFTLLSGIVHSVGFRLETPEGDGPGKHDYFHVQLISAFYTNGGGLVGCPPWLPVSQPAWQFQAGSPVQLILCMIRGMYGSPDLSSLESVEFWNELKAHMESIQPENFTRDKAKRRA
jgi:hypothetical protein